MRNNELQRALESARIARRRAEQLARTCSELRQRMEILVAAIQKNRARAHEYFGKPESKTMNGIYPHRGTGTIN